MTRAPRAGELITAAEAGGLAPRDSRSGSATCASDPSGPGPRPRPRLPLAPGQNGPGQLSLADLGELARSVASAEQVWRPLARFSPEQRWYGRLALTDDYEIWLLSWLPGQCTGFHDHGEASGAFAVAQGKLRETLAAAGRRHVRHRLAAEGSVTRFGGRHLHDVGNVAAEPAVSVHAYSPPLSAMRRYEMTASGLVLVRTERAELHW